MRSYLPLQREGRREARLGSRRDALQRATADPRIDSLLALAELANQGPHVRETAQLQEKLNSGPTQTAAHEEPLVKPTPAAPRMTPVVQRAMGMEVEMRRAITTPTGDVITQGDTPLLNHPYFKLVTDKFQGYSNLELVMKHFDQLAGTEDQAIAELKQRLAAMKALAGQLYGGQGKLGDLVPGIGTAASDTYIPLPVSYEENKKTIAFDPSDARVQDPASDDNLLYVHYTVGFEPKHWFKMINDIAAVTRPDLPSKSRPLTHARHAISLIPDVLAGIDTSTLNPTETEELKGHLALLYTQMSVFAERTLDLDKRFKLRLKRAKERREKAKKELRAIKTRIADVEKDPSLNLVERTTRIKPLEKKRKKLVREFKSSAKQVEDLEAKLDFVGGQPKNKIAALPRATLLEMFGALSANVQSLVIANREKILDLFAQHLEDTLGLDLNEELILESPAGFEASLGNYVKAGLGTGANISQQVLFGGMNEVGIDTTSTLGKQLLPLEFRSIYKKRVTWDELEADALKILKWSRDPENQSLA